MSLQTILISCKLEACTVQQLTDVNASFSRQLEYRGGLDKTKGPKEKNNQLAVYFS